MKVMTVLGTRPEIIRLSRVIPLLDESCDHVLVHTGQNWDEKLSDVFFSDLRVRPPDHHLGISRDTLGSALGDVLRRSYDVITEEEPDAFLVLGDTNSALSAVIAKRLHVPVYHMEAGNRSFDENVPEETNRRMIDHIADFNIAYTEHARRNLLAEGIHPRRVAVTGSPMREVLDHYRGDIAASDVVTRLALEPGGYFMASAHREENVDTPRRLAALLDCLEGLAESFGLPVVMSTHPRTRRRLEEMGLGEDSTHVRFLEPFGFFDYIALQQAAACVISDSGTISEESAMLGFPAVTLRDSMERPEALEVGSILMSGLDRNELVRNVRAATSTTDHHPPVGYDTPDTARRTVNFLLATAARQEQWFGVRPR